MELLWESFSKGNYPGSDPNGVIGKGGFDGFYQV